MIFPICMKSIGECIGVLAMACERIKHSKIVAQPFLFMLSGLCFHFWLTGSRSHPLHREYQLPRTACGPNKSSTWIDAGGLFDVYVAEDRVADNWIPTDLQRRRVLRQTIPIRCSQQVRQSNNQIEYQDSVVRNKTYSDRANPNWTTRGLIILLMKTDQVQF